MDTEWEVSDDPALYRALVEDLPIGLVQTTPAGQILYYNPRAQEILGYGPEDFPDLTARDLYVDPEDRQALIEGLRRRGVHHYEYCLRRKDGRPVWVRGCTRQVLDARGELIYLGFLEDVTAWRQAQEARQVAEQEVRSLAAHLLKVRRAERLWVLGEVERAWQGEVAGWQAELEGVARQLEEGEAALQESVAAMQRRVEASGDGLKRLAAWEPAVREEGLAAALAVQAERLAQQRGVAIEVESPAERLALAPDLEIEWFRLGQELLRYVTHQVGVRQVRVRWRGERGWVVLELEATGPGFPPARADEGEGWVGFGERVRLWGGELSLDGKPDQGLRVQVCFPGAGLQEAVGSAPAGRGSPLLIVSDHGLMRAGVKQVLAASGWPGLIGEVGTLPEALAEVRAHPYQGVIVGLGRGEACEAWLQGWRRGGGRLPVLVISLETGVASMQVCLAAGATGYLSGASAEGHLVEALTAILSGESYLILVNQNDIIAAMTEPNTPSIKPTSHR